MGGKNHPGKSCKALAQGAQGGGGVLIPGSAQKTSGCGTGGHGKSDGGWT